VHYVKKGEKFDPMTLLASVSGEDHTMLDREKVRVFGLPDLKKPGCYQLEYVYEDGSLRGSAPLTVVVWEGEGNGK
jgi:hypothetical protein